MLAAGSVVESRPRLPLTPPHARGQRALDERDVVVLCNQVLKGLAYLRYEKVVVHRDLKVGVGSA